MSPPKFAICPSPSTGSGFLPVWASSPPRLWHDALGTDQPLLPTYTSVTSENSILAWSSCPSLTFFLPLSTPVSPVITWLSPLAQALMIASSPVASVALFSSESVSSPDLSSRLHFKLVCVHFRTFTTQVIPECLVWVQLQAGCNGAANMNVCELWDPSWVRGGGHPSNSYLHFLAGSGHCSEGWGE